MPYHIIPPIWRGWKPLGLGTGFGRSAVFRLLGLDPPARSGLMLWFDFRLGGGAAPFPETGRPLPATSKCPAKQNRSGSRRKLRLAQTREGR
jgi:hypothetical protein